MKFSIRGARASAPRLFHALPLGVALLAAGCGGGGSGINLTVSPPPDLAVEAVSTRADLVSNGDVLVRASVPAGTDITKATLSLNGTALEAPFHAAPDGKGWLALVKGLNLGSNTLLLRAGENTAQLEVTNRPNGGPVFSGPQIQPWTCRAGATNALCDRPTTYTYSYRAVGGTTFQAYDPANPPAASTIQQVTTQSGATVPYIVRVESFNQNRSGVSFATLFDPAKTWTPWQPQAQWNKGVHVLQGAGCGTSYFDQAAGSPLNDNALRKGYIVATVALLHNTINCNQIVQAEAAIMAKEHIAETYGLWDIIFGMGSSGGAISQISDQNAYPGIYDGIVLNHTFVDSDASRLHSYDCKVVYDYFAKPGMLAYTDPQKEAVVGMLTGCNSQVNTTRYEVYNPSTGTSCDVPQAQKFDPVTNPTGVRCTLQDYQVNQVGRRPDGFANGRLDTEGVQFGLKAVLSGAITPAQFVEMNANIGGHDINFRRIATRTVADRAGLKRMYQTGISNVANNLQETPILDQRLHATDFHQVFNVVMTRARLDRAQGHHDNHVVWRSLVTSEPTYNTAAFDTMEAWIKAIKADKRDVPQARKVVDNKPEMARDRCTNGTGTELPLSSCTRPQELPRVLAGGPDTNEGGKCQLKPLNQADYPGVTFTPTQWQTLQQTFPTGVCDWARPLVDFTFTTPWLIYDGTSYQELGAAPKSVVR